MTTGSIIHQKEINILNITFYQKYDSCLLRIILYQKMSHIFRRLDKEELKKIESKRTIENPVCFQKHFVS